MLIVRAKGTDESCLGGVVWGRRGILPWKSRFESLRVRVLRAAPSPPATPRRQLSQGSDGGREMLTRTAPSQATGKQASKPPQGMTVGSVSKPSSWPQQYCVALILVAPSISVSVAQRSMYCVLRCSAGSARRWAHGSLPYARDAVEDCARPVCALSLSAQNMYRHWLRILHLLLPAPNFVRHGQPARRTLCLVHPRLAA